MPPWHRHLGILRFHICGPNSRFPRRRHRSGSCSKLEDPRSHHHRCQQIHLEILASRIWISDMCFFLWQNLLKYFFHLCVIMSAIMEMFYSFVWKSMHLVIISEKDLYFWNSLISYCYLTACQGKANVLKSRKYWYIQHIISQSLNLFHVFHQKPLEYQWRIKTAEKLQVKFPHVLQIENSFIVLAEVAFDDRFP